MANNAERPNDRIRGTRALDPDATGAPTPLPAHGPGLPGRETHERQAAWLRGDMNREEPPGSNDSAPAQLIEVRAHRLLRVLSDSVRDYAIFLIDVNGIIRHWGEGARLMKWWTTAQACGGHLRMLYPDGGAGDGTAETHLQAAMDTGEYSGEGLRVRNDGSTFWAAVTLTALRDDDGALIGFAKVTRDLSAEHAIKVTLKAHGAAEARSIAGEAQRLRNLFVASVSHEIRTPLNALLGYLSILDRESRGRERQRTHIARIRTSATHLMEVVNDLLDVSRLEAGRFPVTLVAARIGRAIEAALADIEPQAAAKQVAIANAVSGNAADMPYWGDESRVRQILSNLLSNAVKFTPRGGRVTVSAGSAETPSPEAAVGTGPWVYVRVEDNGTGIAPERLEAIFEPYTQASAEDAERGTGLGLSISRRLARLMGGDLSVQSDVGGGSTFVLWLPVAPTGPPNAAATQDWRANG
jgi:PAS domain S-box-containing protein